MKKYLALYMIPAASLAEMRKSMTPETQKAGMAKWMEWMNSHKSMMLEPGMPAGKNKRVMGSEVMDMSNEVTGYSIIEAESHDAAAAIFKDSPHMKMPGAYVEVMELMQMGGM